jgi:hypothetical protein
MSLVGIQSTPDRKKIWEIKFKIGKKHMRVCSKHFVDDFIPLVWTQYALTVHLFDSFEVRYTAQPQITYTRSDTLVETFDE